LLQFAVDQAHVVALHIGDILHLEGVSEVEEAHQEEDGHLLVGMVEEHHQDHQDAEVHHEGVHRHDLDHHPQGEDLLVVDHLVKNLDHLQDLALAQVVEVVQDQEVNLKL